MIRFLAVVVLVAGCAAVPAHCSIVLSESFVDITTLATSGWVMNNRSSPLGTTGFFQGNEAVFPAWSGPVDAYIGANYENALDYGTISNWLITPVVPVNDGSILSFYTRTTTPSSLIYPDRLEVRFSNNGSSTNVGSSATSVGDFTNLLLTINPSLTTSGYPSGWTQYTLTLSGLGGPTSGRFALRYFVTDAGPNAPNADYIGVDDLTVETTVPEPVTSLLTAAGILGIVIRKRMRKGLVKPQGQ